MDLKDINKRRISKMSNFARLIIDLINYLDLEEFKRLLNYGISIKEVTLCVNNARVGVDERG